MFLSSTTLCSINFCHKNFLSMARYLKSITYVRTNKDSIPLNYQARSFYWHNGRKDERELIYRGASLCNQERGEKLERKVILLPIGNDTVKSIVYVKPGFFLWNNGIVLFLPRVSPLLQNGFFTFVIIKRLNNVKDDQL